MSSLVSIIVPVYNAEKYLDECITSIINQTYKNLEIILVNDGSIDRSDKICDEYANKDNRIKVIHQINKGLAEARNTGLNIAKGDFINFIDSDDYIDLDEIEVLVKNRVENGVVCNGSIVLYKNRKIVKKSNKIYKLNKHNALKLYILEGASWSKRERLDYFIGSSMNNKLFSRNIFRNIRFDKNVKVSEDIDVMFDIILASENIVLLPYAKYYYVHRNINSITSQSFHLNMLDSIKVKIKIENKVRNILPNFLKYAEIGTMFYCVYLINKIAKLSNIEREKYKDVIKNIKKIIIERKNIVKELGFFGKLKIYMIMFNCNLYMNLVRFVKIKLKV